MLIGFELLGYRDSCCCGIEDSGKACLLLIWFIAWLSRCVLSMLFHTGSHILCQLPNNDPFSPCTGFSFFSIDILSSFRCRLGTRWDITTPNPRPTTMAPRRNRGTLTPYFALFWILFTVTARDANALSNPCHCHGLA